MKMHLLYLLLMVAVSSSAQLASINEGDPGPDSRREDGPVQWMTFEEAVQRSKTEKRKIFIDVYTDWCGWCKVMDKNTFSEPEVAKILNKDFYPVKFNAEQTEDVVFNGVTFKFVPVGGKGYHQLAAALLSNQLSYPNFVFLTDDFKIIPVIRGSSSLPGYRKPEQFHPYLSFVVDDFYRKMPFEDYEKNEYKSPYVVQPPVKDSDGQ